jgi:hypothetical protein
MAQTREQLRAKIRRHLGHPFVKVELCNEHIDDAINDARDMWIKWAVGNATQERYLTLLLMDGKWIYDLPSGVVEVVDYRDDFYGGSFNTFAAGGHNTLFTLDNAMYMQGYGNYWSGGSYGYGGLEGGYNPGTYMGYNGTGIGGVYNMITAQLSRQLMGDGDHYHVNKFHWTYHRSTNQLQLQPIPPCENNLLTVTTDLSGGIYAKDNLDCSTLSAGTTGTTFKSPGFVLLRTYMVEGAGLPTYVPPLSGEVVDSIYDISDSYSDWLFSEKWVSEYTLALCMITLGNIRRKFAGYASLGNQGLALDGDQLVSEGNDKRRELEEELDLKHAYEGYGIYLG